MGDSELLKELLGFRSYQGMTRDRLAQAVTLKSLAKTDDVDELAQLVAAACEKIPKERQRDAVKASFAIDYSHEQVAGNRITLLTDAKGYSLTLARGEAKAGISVLESILLKEFLSRRRARPMISLVIQTEKGIRVGYDNFLEVSTTVGRDALGDIEVRLNIDEVHDENIVFAIKFRHNKRDGEAKVALYCAAVKNSEFDLSFFKIFTYDSSERSFKLRIDNNSNIGFYLQNSENDDEWGHSSIKTLMPSGSEALNHYGFYRLYTRHDQSAAWHRIFDNIIDGQSVVGGVQVSSEALFIMEEAVEKARNNIPLEASKSNPSSDNNK